MTVEGAEALIRLADLCSTFHLPIVTFTDQPGLLIGTRAEQRATIRPGVRAISARLPGRGARRGDHRAARLRRRRRRPDQPAPADPPLGLAVG